MTTANTTPTTSFETVRTTVIDSHRTTIRSVRRRLAQVDGAHHRRDILRALRESIRDLLTAHATIVDDLTSELQMVAQANGSDGEMDFAGVPVTIGVVRNRRADLISSDIHANMQASCRDLLRMESDLFFPPPEHAPGRPHDSEAFGHAALERLMTTVEKATAKQVPDPVARAFARIEAARAANMDQSVIDQLTEAAKRVLANETALAPVALGRVPAPPDPVPHGPTTFAQDAIAATAPRQTGPTFVNE